MHQRELAPLATILNNFHDDDQMQLCREACNSINFQCDSGGGTIVSFRLRAGIRGLTAPDETDLPEAPTGTVVLMQSELLREICQKLSQFGESTDIAVDLIEAAGRHVATFESTAAWEQGRVVVAPPAATVESTWGHIRGQFPTSQLESVACAAVGLSRSCALALRAGALALHQRVPDRAAALKVSMALNSETGEMYGEIAFFLTNSATWR